jgi:hypothetical protein
MDKLERLISEKQTEIDRAGDEINALAKKRERLVIELDALRQAASLRPTANGPVARVDPAAASRGGRQKGDISKEWRRILYAVWQRHRRVSYGEIQIIAQELGIETQLPSIRERVRNLGKTGLLTGTSKLGFLVSKQAVERFGFSDEEPSDEAEGSS